MLFHLYTFGKFVADDTNANNNTAAAQQADGDTSDGNPQQTDSTAAEKQEGEETNGEKTKEGETTEETTGHDGTNDGATGETTTALQPQASTCFLAKLQNLRQNCYNKNLYYVVVRAVLTSTD